MVGDEVQVRSTVDATSQIGKMDAKMFGKTAANDTQPEAAASPNLARGPSQVTKPLSLVKDA